MTSTAKIPPKPGKDVVYVDIDDEITGLIDKVENAKEKVVALVLPKRAAMLQSIINMRLLARGAKNAGKNLVLITNEEALLPLAGAAGIHVAKSLQSTPEIPSAPEALVAGAVAARQAKKSEPTTAPPLNEKTPKTAEEAEAAEEDLPKKIDYGSSVGALAATHEAEHPETIELDDEEPEEEQPKPKPSKTPKDKSLKVPNFDRFRTLLFLGVLGVVALIVFIVLAVFILPKATISIQTTSTPVNATLTATTSGGAKTVDQAKKVLPGFSKTSDQTLTAQATATGQQNNGTKATGSATLVNCGNSAVTVPAGTGISGSGLTYITQSSVALDAGNFDSHGNCKTSGAQASSGTSNVTAQTGGTKYNTSFSGSSVAGYGGVTASGSASGGTDNIQTVLSQGDVDSAVNKAVTTTTTAAYAKTFEDQLATQGYYVFTSTLQTGTPSVTASPSVGQPASTASLTIKVTYTVLAVQKADLSNFITTQMASQVDKTKQKLSNNLLNDATVSVNNQTSPTDASLSIQENTTAVPIINVNSVKQLAEGKKSGTIKSTLETWPGVKSVNVKLSPFWVSKVPGKPSKVTVVVSEVKS